MQDTALQKELQQLSPEELRALLSSAGHGQLLRETQVDEKLVAAAKDEGNALFRQGKTHEAIAAYSRCIAMDPSNAVCLSNRAAAYLKLKQFDCVIADCSKAIEIAPTIKPFMRRAAAYIGVQQFDNAVADLTAALEFEPRNKECCVRLQTIVDIATEMSSGRDENAKAALRRAGIRAAVIVSTRGGWTQNAVRGNPGPAAVNGHTLFEGDDGRVYLFGGRAVREQKPSVFVRDNDDLSSWDTVVIKGADVPSSRAWHSTSVIGDLERGCYCVYGGVSSRGEDPNVHLLVPAQPVRFQWVSPRCLQDPKEIPAPRSGHTAVSVPDDKCGRVVYMFGGRTRQGVDSKLLVLKISTIPSIFSSDDEYCATITWEEVAPFNRNCEEPNGNPDWPSARDGHSMCLLQGTETQAPQLVIFGGNGQLNDEKMNDVWLFDLKKQCWTSLECSGDIPTPRSYHTAHVVAELLFVVGGRTADSEDDSVYMLDISTAEWFKVPIPKDHALTPRAWHSSVLTKAGKLFVLGGGTYHGPLKDAGTLEMTYFQSKAAKINSANYGRH